MNAALLAIALAAVSPSRIGIVVESIDPTAAALLDACPALVVARLPTTHAADLARWRANCAGGKLVAQVGGSAPTVDAASAASWSSAWLADVQAAQPTPGFDAIEGPWEPVAAAGAAANLAAFWSTFATNVRLSGFVPVVGALPPVAVAPGGFCDTVTAVRGALGAAPFAWSYHARSGTMSQSGAEATTALGYRTLATACGLAGVPLYLTQAGPGLRGWAAGDASWLSWLDGEVRTDRDVVGAAAGGTGVPLGPVAAALATYLQTPQPGGTDGGADGGADGGGDAGPDGGFDAGGGVIILPPGPPDGPPGQARNGSGCASTGAGFTLLAVLPALFLLRRRRRAG
jgi:hypothetical protein